MDNSKSILEEVFKKDCDDYQLRRLYALLDKAKIIIGKCLKNRNDDKYIESQINEFRNECQWAKGFIREEFNSTKKEKVEENVLPVEVTDKYIDDWKNYIAKMIEWIKKAIQNGKYDRWEYEQLYNLRDSLIERASNFYQTFCSKYKLETKQYEQEIEQRKRQKNAEENTSIESGQKENDGEENNTGTKTSPLAALKNPVSCVVVGGVIHKRSDNIATKLKKQRYNVIKTGGKYYCEAEDAAVLWPKWKKYWQKHTNTI